MEEKIINKYDNKKKENKKRLIRYCIGFASLAVLTNVLGVVIPTIGVDAIVIMDGVLVLVSAETLYSYFAKNKEFDRKKDKELFECTNVVEKEKIQSEDKNLELDRNLELEKNVYYEDTNTKVKTLIKK